MIFRRLLRASEDFVRKASRRPLPEDERFLYQFSSAEDLERWNIFSDAAFGGCSQAELCPSDREPGTASFRGVYSRRIQNSDHSRLKRSGFAGMVTRSMENGYLDLSDFGSLVFRVKGDGRPYLANLRTDNWVVGEGGDDLWQAVLPVKAGGWQEIEIPFVNFLLTWRGRVVEEQMELNSGRITSLGIALAGREDLQEEGPFRLDLDWIAARNLADEDEEGELDL